MDTVTQVIENLRVNPNLGKALSGSVDENMASLKTLYLATHGAVNLDALDWHFIATNVKNQSKDPVQGKTPQEIANDRKNADDAARANAARDDAARDERASADAANRQANAAARRDENFDAQNPNAPNFPLSHQG